MDNKLILDTRSEEMVYTSLSNILDISRNELEKSIYSVYKKYKDDNNINLIFELKKHLNLDDNFFFEYITINHFTSRLDYNKKNFQINNLEDTLLNENTLTVFLKENHLELKKENNEINVYYKNEYQRLDKNKERNGRLENRLKELSDSCVNGFLFSDLNDLNYQFLKNIPEILDDLLTYLDLDEIKTKYVKRSTGLRVSIIVNIDDLILDDYASITSKFQKSEYILREIFYYLSDSNNYINPIIRLKDEKNVYNHEILEIKEI